VGSEPARADSESPAGAYEPEVWRIDSPGAEVAIALYFQAGGRFEGATRSTSGELLSVERWRDHGPEAEGQINTSMQGCRLSRVRSERDPDHAMMVSRSSCHGHL
jgi:hypothetical protein